VRALRRTDYAKRTRPFAFAWTNPSAEDRRAARNKIISATAATAARNADIVRKHIPWGVISLEQPRVHAEVHRAHAERVRAAKIRSIRAY